MTGARHPRAAMVFAAGFGTRMAPLTRDRPKPLITVSGRALIDHALDLVADAGLRAVVNTHYLAHMVEAHLRDRPGVVIRREEPEILETGGGLKAALPALGPGPVATINTDMAWAGPNPLRQLLDAWDPARMEALLLLVPLDRTCGHKGRGDFALDGSGRITRQTGSGLVYSGAQILETGGLAAITDKVFSLNRLWDTMIARDRAFGITYDGRWADVGTPAAIPLAEAMLAAGGKNDGIRTGEA